SPGWIVMDRLRHKPVTLTHPAPPPNVGSSAPFGVNRATRLPHVPVSVWGNASPVTTILPLASNATASRVLISPLPVKELNCTTPLPPKVGYKDPSGLNRATKIPSLVPLLIGAKPPTDPTTIAFPRLSMVRPMAPVFSPKFRVTVPGFEP